MQYSIQKGWNIIAIARHSSGIAAKYTVSCAFQKFVKINNLHLRVCIIIIIIIITVIYESVTGCDEMLVTGFVLVVHELESPQHVET